jgi:dTDP-4-dehydrorhamnose 3,5-epimerase
MITLSDKKYTPEELGIKLLSKKIFVDNRGEFLKTIETGLGFVFPDTGICDQYLSRSTKGVFRGLHYQKYPYLVTKLINVIEGSIVDFGICVDKNSEFYGISFRVEIDETTPFFLLVPSGFAHGFYTKSDMSMVLSSMNNGYQSEYEECYSYKLIQNFFYISDQIIISDKDKQAKRVL